MGLDDADAFAGLTCVALDCQGEVQRDHPPSEESGRLLPAGSGRGGSCGSVNRGSRQSRMSVTTEELKRLDRLSKAPEKNLSRETQPCQDID